LETILWGDTVKKILTVVAATALMGLSSALAQDQSKPSPSADAAQQAAQKPDAKQPAVKRVAAVHTRRQKEWYDWYYWPWNFIPDNLPRDSHRKH
jgi:hypothetical protein